MKQHFGFVLSSYLGLASLHAQQGIGTNQPNANTALHIEATAKGVLLPQVTLQASNTFTLAATASSTDESILLFNTQTATNTGLAGTGFYYWEGGPSGQWKKLSTDRFVPVSDEQLFLDNVVPSGYLYISLMVNGNWRVVRYRKDDPNDELVATETNNAGVTTRPTTLAQCQALNYN